MESIRVVWFAQSRIQLVQLYLMLLPLVYSARDVKLTIRFSSNVRVQNCWNYT